MRRPAPAAFLVAAAIGGALGALSRFGISSMFPAGSGFPWATFGINVSGSALLALLPALSFVRRHPVLPVLLGPGLLGGFTTLSTASSEARHLLASGSGALAAAYVVGTLLAALAAVNLAHHLSSPAEQLEFESEDGNE